MAILPQWFEGDINRSQLQTYLTVTVEIFKSLTNIAEMRNLNRPDLVILIGRLSLKSN
ncbi:hypothetical protein JJD41_02730 [Oxynema sp. CENA135]|nr:hypothetical protein [Oxynema sp. CENA135]